MTTYKKTIAILLALFFIVNVVYLHRVPGLMGDEASEGQNVYELLDQRKITVVGERSYIGPLLDYVRVPFVEMFGYTALALRIPVFLISLLTFVLAASVFRRWFGEEVSLFPLVSMMFSLPYLTHQRLAWAITFLPFFFFLTVWLVQRPRRYKWLWVGLSAGLGLHTHIMFAPTLGGLLVGVFAGLHPRPAITRIVVNILVLAIGFWAAFGTQFAVLQLYTEDQGDPAAVGEVWRERLADLPRLLPVILSGSSFVAHYTGNEFAPTASSGIVGLILILASVGVALLWRNKYVWLWIGGLLVHLGVLLYMIDRFSLRYFLVFTLGIYALAGLGVGQIIVRLQRFSRYTGLTSSLAVAVAVGLSGLWVVVVLGPFLRTGGSVADFSLGNRTNNANALVDERPLIECLRGQGSVSSEDVHIYNRLLFLSHEFEDLVVMTEDQAAQATLLVHYRQGSDRTLPPSQQLCPSLAHFVVEKVSHVDSRRE